MRSCHLALVLIGTTLHGAQALDRRPAIAIRPSSRSHDILRGGAGNKHPVVPPLVQGLVKTIRGCIWASNVISFLMLVHLVLAGSIVHFALACSTAQVFNFVAQRLLRAWRPREFDRACVEMSKTPQRLPIWCYRLTGMAALLHSSAAYHVSQGRALPPRTKIDALVVLLFVSGPLLICID